MASLVEIAQAMEKEKAAKAAAVQANGANLTLVDIAKEQSRPLTEATTKPLTLTEVAKQMDAAEKDNAAASVDLHRLAQEVDQEQRAQVDAAISKAAKEVKAEQVQERARIVQAAVREVAREEKLEAAKAMDVAVAETIKIKPPKETTQSKAPSPTTTATGSTFVPVKAEESEDDDGGYSSFEEESVKKEEKKKTVKKKKKVEDNQSEASKDEGPELTTVSDSPEAKQFLHAVYRGDLRRVRDLMHQQDDMNSATADQHGWSALHWAVSQGHADVLELLLATQAPVNAAEHVSKWTPLHLAVLRASLFCVKKLLHAGARTDLLDAYGDSVLDLARAHKGKRKERLLQILMEHRHRAGAK